MMTLIASELDAYLECYTKVNPNSQYVPSVLQDSDSQLRRLAVTRYRRRLIHFLTIIEAVDDLLGIAEHYSSDLMRHERGVPVTEHYHHNFVSRLGGSFELVVENWFELMNPTDVADRFYDDEACFRAISVQPPSKRIVRGRVRHTSLFTLEVLLDRIRSLEPLQFVVATRFVRDGAEDAPTPETAKEKQRPATKVRLETRKLDLSTPEGVHQLREHMLAAHTLLLNHASRLGSFVRETFPLDAIAISAWLPVERPPMPL